MVGRWNRFVASDGLPDQYRTERLFPSNDDASATGSRTLRSLHRSLVDSWAVGASHSPRSAFSGAGAPTIRLVPAGSKRTIWFQEVTRCRWLGTYVRARRDLGSRSP